MPSCPPRRSDRAPDPPGQSSSTDSARQCASMSGRHMTSRFPDRYRSRRQLVRQPGSHRDNRLLEAQCGQVQYGRRPAFVGSRVANTANCALAVFATRHQMPSLAHCLQQPYCEAEASDRPLTRSEASPCHGVHWESLVAVIDRAVEVGYTCQFRFREVVAAGGT